MHRLALFARTMQSTTGLLLLCAMLSFAEANAQVESRILAPLPDQARDDAVGFTLAGQGYIVGGRKSDFAISDQLWKYDPSSDSWEAKNPMLGIPRQYSSSFTLDGKAYVLCGLADPGLHLSEVWCYDPVLDLWMQLNDFPGGARFAPVSFVWDGRAYLGLGKGVDTYYDDLWKYDKAQDSWSLVLRFPIALYSSIAVQVDGYMYIGLGVDSMEVFNARIWFFDGGIGAASSFDEGLGYADAVELASMGLVIGGKTIDEDAVEGTVLMRTLSDPYGPESLTWTRTETMAGGAKRNGASFSIGEKGYYFGGKDEQGVKSNALIEFSRIPIAQSVRVHPNPSSSAFTIESQQAFEHIELFDLSGRSMFEKDMSSPHTDLLLHLDRVASGVYLLRLDGREGQRLMIID